MAVFAAEIYKIGVNPVVDPPDDILHAIFARAGRSRGAIPVRGTLNQTEFVQTLVKYGGKWRLYINGPMLRDSGLSVGDVADVAIEFDPRPRDVPMPPRLAAALRKDKPAKTAFDQLSPSRKKEIFKYLGSLKTRESIDKNIERVLSHLTGREAGAQYPLMRRKKGG